MHKSASLFIKGSIASSVAVAVFLVLVQFLAQFSLGEKKMFVIKSGSMSPAIDKGSLIVSAKHDEYNSPDVVTFTTDNGPVTHRIKESTEGKYITQGDANNTEDPGVIGSEQIVGAVEFVIPYLGYILQLTKQTIGFICLILVPLCLLLIIESVNVVTSIKKNKYETA